MQADPVLLQVRGVTKTFPGVRALDAVGFDLRRGEVHALVGENGAGKTTLMHVLGGILRPDSGEIRLEGRPVRFRHPMDAARCGIRVVFQELSLAPNLSVAENIFANRQPVFGPNLVDRRRLHAQARQMLERFRLEVHPATPVRRLSPGQQQVVEILKNARVRTEILGQDTPQGVYDIFTSKGTR